MSLQIALAAQTRLAQGLTLKVQFKINVDKGIVVPVTIRES
jgi:hypothetical protein